MKIDTKMDLILALAGLHGAISATYLTDDERAEYQKELDEILQVIEDSEVVIGKEIEG